MEYFNKKRPIYSTILAFVGFVILSLILHQGKDILHWVGLSAIFACVVGVISLRITIQDAKNRQEYERLKKLEESNEKQANDVEKDNIELKNIEEKAENLGHNGDKS